MCCGWIRHLHISDPLRPCISIRYYASSAHITDQHHCAEALMWHQNDCICCVYIARQCCACRCRAMSCPLIEHHYLVNCMAALGDTRSGWRGNHHHVRFGIILLDCSTQRQCQHDVAEERCLHNDPLHARHRRCCHDHSSGLRRSSSSSTATCRRVSSRTPSRSFAKSSIGNERIGAT